jgi:uncharacterized protein (TIGR02452 family)
MNSKKSITSEQLVEAFVINQNIIKSNPKLERLTRQSIINTSLYYGNSASQNASKLYTPKISINKDTTIFAAAKLKKKYNNVAILNFASAVNPGGGVTVGAKAQEESICRCSNLYNCLIKPDLWQQYYKFHREDTNSFFSNRVIYSKGVTVFMTDTEIPEYTDDWFKVDVITCAAPNQSNQSIIDSEVTSKVFIDRISSILNIAFDNGIEAIVLGAFGCGAYKNPPRIVADAFKYVLVNLGYENSFKEIVFAIKRSELPCPNLIAFENTFYGLSEEQNLMRFCDGNEMIFDKNVNAFEKRKQEDESHKKYLPVGTIVELRNDNKKLIVLGFCFETTDKTVFDYCGCLYPEGLTYNKELKTYNHYQISKIYHIGYFNYQHQIFRDKLLEEKNDAQNIIMKKIKIREKQKRKVVILFSILLLLIIIGTLLLINGLLP